MNSKEGRYSDEPVLEHGQKDGSAVRYVRPRILPQTNSYMVTMPHRVSDNDRPDILAFQQLGNPTAWWMIADSNDAMHPDQLLDEIGESITIPVPGTQVTNR